MEVVVTTGAISRAKLQSNHHHKQTNIQFFYKPHALPVVCPPCMLTLLDVSSSIPSHPTDTDHSSQIWISRMSDKPVSRLPHHSNSSISTWRCRQLIVLAVLPGGSCTIKFIKISQHMDDNEHSSEAHFPAQHGLAGTRVSYSGFRWSQWSWRWWCQLQL